MVTMLQEPSQRICHCLLRHSLSTERGDRLREGVARGCREPTFGRHRQGAPVASLVGCGDIRERKLLEVPVVVSRDEGVSCSN